MRQRIGGRARGGRGRAGLVATLLALAVLLAPPGTTQAHTCAPDANVGVSGRLIMPRGSGLVSVELPSRETRVLPVLPAQGVTTGAARSVDGSLLAVPRFWRPPDHRVGGQDILLVSPDGGAPVQTLHRGQPGEVLGAPAWLPDGSLVYERRILSGTEEAVNIERARPGDAPTVLAEKAAWPSVSPDGMLLVLVRSGDSERLLVKPIDGGPERVLVDAPHLLSIAFPRFSPDGAWVAFTAAADPSGAPVARGRPVEAVPSEVGPDAAGGGESALLRAPFALAPFSPTSLGLAPFDDRLAGGPLRALAGRFDTRSVRAHGLPWDVWVVRPDGTDLRRVTAFADDDSSAAWSPDSRWLATLSAEAVHVVALEGPENYCISGEGGYGALEWLP